MYIIACLSPEHLAKSLKHCSNHNNQSGCCFSSAVCILKQPRGQRRVAEIHLYKKPSNCSPSIFPDFNKHLLILLNAAIVCFNILVNVRIPQCGQSLKVAWQENLKIDHLCFHLVRGNSSHHVVVHTHTLCCRHLIYIICLFSIGVREQSCGSIQVLWFLWVIV